MTSRASVIQAAINYGMAYFDYGLSYKDESAQAKEKIKKQKEEKFISLLREFEESLLSKEANHDN